MDYLLMDYLLAEAINSSNARMVNQAQFQVNSKDSPPCNLMFLKPRSTNPLLLTLRSIKVWLSTTTGDIAFASNVPDELTSNNGPTLRNFTLVSCQPLLCPSETFF